MSAVAETLRSWVVREVVVDRRRRVAIGAAAFAVATAFGAQVAVPLPWTPVPMTLQPLFVILAGAILGPLPGAASMAAYVLVGAAGAPVFSNGAFGIPWLMGATGGYLLAAPAAAFVTGWLVGEGKSPTRRITGLTLGVLTMYAGGAAQLLLVTGQPVGHVLAVGVVPFLLGDATKILAAFLLVGGLKRTSLGRW